MRRPETTADTFWAYVVVGEPDACWIWTGGRTPFGHGRASFYAQTNGTPCRQVMAHHVAWTLHRNPAATAVEALPPGHVVMHTCDNPPCCNPAHLVLGTKADNTADMMHKRRDYWSTRTHCKNGHEFAVHAVVVTHKNGARFRRCNACRREGGH